MSIYEHQDKGGFDTESVWNRLSDDDKSDAISFARSYVQQVPDVTRREWPSKFTDTAKLVREVAIALMGGRYVSIPCAGGGSVSSETGWDGRKKDEYDENFRLRCWLHAAKTVKASRNVQRKRKGYGI